MSKSTRFFFCKSCGYQSAAWIGKCPSCGGWNTFEQEVIHREDKQKSKSISVLAKSKPKPLSDITLDEAHRMGTGYRELDLVLGGGIVSGSLTLIGGEPGIGKSTLMLQMGLKLYPHKVLYISGEESEAQLKMRAKRIFKHPDNSLYILTETQTQEIIKHIEELQPEIVIVDSIQTMQSEWIDSAAGSISQIKECAAEFQHLAKTTSIPIFLIGHITKEGAIAGPKILEHIVDTVLQFEGDQHYGYRIVRCIKNRFGSTSELGIFEMSATGLREVINPSEMLLSNHDELLSGTAVASVLEGNRPLMIETQALVSTAVYGVPQRSATGFDLRRLNMLLAVLEKRCHFKLGAKDVFVNIVGGFHIDDPAINLAIMASILSSTADVAIDASTCFAGEMGLSGEVRPVSRIEQRVAEADKLGFQRFFCSKHNVKGWDSSKYKIKLIPLGKIEEMWKLLFEV